MDNRADRVSPAGVALPVRELLAASAAPRQRAVDEHMFTVTWSGLTATFRLQLFTAAGVRPVAIATQTRGEGMSLTNNAEIYAAEVWRRHFPNLAEPPVWIQLELFPDRPDDNERFTLVTFAEVRPYELADPAWIPMSDATTGRLVGAQVDRSRGSGYKPRAPEPEEQPVYQVAWVSLLPRPAGVNRGCISGVPPWWRRLGRQILPRHGPRDCCYYHGVSWHKVSAAAIRIIAQVRREGLSGEAFAGRAADLADAQDMPVIELRALGELLSPPIGIQLGQDSEGHEFYINGRHRTTAMLDAGVRRTVVIRWKMPDA